MDDAARITPVPAGPDLSGRTLGDFRVLRRLGQGGMGQVYLAEQVSLKRKVALKILRPDLAADPTSLQRFKLEAESVARATHANIVQVYAIGEVEGLPYMALEFEGKNLRQYLARKGPPDLPLALGIMRQVAAALARAGELGIIHRDIKPENILLTRKGEVKVADFGLSRCLDGGRAPLNLTQSGTTMGTPLYMSPEQVEGRALDPRTDIYSFGVTCYHMLAGQPPFQGASAFEVALQHVRGDPVPLSAVRPDLPAALCAVVHKMLAKDPARRYQTARELLKDLGRLRDNLSGTAAVVARAAPSRGAATPATGSMEGMPTQAVGAQPTARRSRLLPFVAGLSLLLALAGGAARGWVRHQHAPPLTEVTPPPTPYEAERVRPWEREHALRTLVERALNAPPTSPPETLDTFRLCLQLGLLYLDTDRLSEADELFARLARMARPYRVLGQLGRGIVLALRSQPQPSNQVFREAFPRPNAQTQPARRFELWQNPQWRYWMTRALHYNAANGLPDEEVPQALRGLLHPQP